MNTLNKLLISAGACLCCIGSAPAQETPSYDYDFNATVLCDAQWFGSRRSDGNHDLHSYYLVIGDKELEEGYPQKSSTTYVFDFFGEAPADEYNPQPPTGTYTFSTEKKSGVLYEGSCVYIVDGNGNYEVDRTFNGGKLDISTYEKDGNTYYKYEFDLTDELGKTHHVNYESRFISYSDESQGSVDLEKDLNFTPKHAKATYRSFENGVMEVQLLLDTFIRDDEGKLYYEPLPGEEMYMTIYMPYDKEIANGKYIPTEDYGASFTMQDGEIVEMAGGVRYPIGSYVQYVFGGQKVAWGVVKTGSLEISGEGENRKIVGDFTTDFGFNIKFTYEGEIALSNFPETGLTEDMQLDLEGAEATFDCVGDIDRLLHCRNWYLTLLPAEGKDHGFTTLICSRTENFYDGVGSTVYEPSPSRIPWKDEFQKGYINDKGQLGGTWMMSQFDENGQPKLNAPGNNGSITVTRHDDKETYTLSFELDDNAGHKFSGSWTGKPELINTCNDELSSVSEITVDENADVKIFDLNGNQVRSIDAPGVYIIRAANGSTSKKIVK